MTESAIGTTTLFRPELAAQIRRLEIRARKSASADVTGSYRSAFRGSGLVFSDIREYEPGDDIKHIHWKATARTGRVYVKSYEEERQLRVLLAVDISRSTAFGAGTRGDKHAKALEFAALVALLASRNQDSIGLCLYSNQVHDFLPPKRTRSQLYKVLGALSAARELPAATDLNPALRYIRDTQRRGTVIFLLSDFFASSFEDELRLLCRRHEVVCVALEDDLDRALPNCGLVEFEGAEGGGRVLIDTSSAEVRARLSAAHAARMKDLRMRCLKSGADFIVVDENPLEPLALLMEERTRRRR